MIYARLGDEMLLRYRYPDGRLQAALPLRVVHDDEAITVGWLPNGTDIMYWALADGSDPRRIPLAERFRQRLGTAPRVWQGPGVLRVMPKNGAFQVLHFWDEDQRFAGWYVNLERNRSRTGSFFDTVDQHLDLVITPDCNAVWKDEDEAEAAVDADQLPRADLDSARVVGESIMRDIDGLLTRVGDWRGWTPPDGFDRPLTLPSDWND
jgi:hypothetical protein